MYDICYFCWDQLPKLKKESTASFFVNFGRNRGTKEPAYITVCLIKVSLLLCFIQTQLHWNRDLYKLGNEQLTCETFQRDFQERRCEKMKWQLVGRFSFLLFSSLFLFSFLFFLYTFLFHRAKMVTLNLFIYKENSKGYILQLLELIAFHDLCPGSPLFWTSLSR